MKRSVLILLILCLAYMVRAQEKVSLEYKVTRESEKVFALHIIATISPGWHIYAQIQPSGGISIPTKITISQSPLFVLSGKTREVGTPKKQKVELLHLEQNIYEGTVDFIQKVQLKVPVKTQLKGAIIYQVCTDEQCLPPVTTNFEVAIG